LAGVDIDIQPGMVLPLPDDAAAAAARARLSAIDTGISAPTVTALGMLAEAVVQVAAMQGNPYPRPILSTRVVLLTGAHAGGIVAGPTPDPRNALPLQHLAVTAGAGIVTLEWQPASAAIELEDAITDEQMDSALRAGWAEADRAADEGIELLVLAAGGAGASTAAAAVVAAVTGAEPTALIARVITPAGFFDDNAWMTRCLALRDALHRVRDRDGGPRTVLTALGGADLAAAAGLILGAASRRTPVMIDGPVGAAAALVANDFSPQSRAWVMLPDTGRHMAVRFAAEALELRPWLDLCLDLGEGSTALAALPMLQTALTLAGVGEPVEPTPLSRFDSTGNQVFVGVARPVEPADTEPADTAQVETAQVETEQVETAQVETEPADTGSSETEPTQTRATETDAGPAGPDAAKETPDEPEKPKPAVKAVPKAATPKAPTKAVPVKSAPKSRAIPVKEVPPKVGPLKQPAEAKDASQAREASAAKDSNEAKDSKGAVDTGQVHETKDSVHVKDTTDNAEVQEAVVEVDEPSEAAKEPTKDANGARPAEVDVVEQTNVDSDGNASAEGGGEAEPVGAGAAASADAGGSAPRPRKRS
jgi:NaMN:DMB phosphoribosyltransferase